MLKYNELGGVTIRREFDPILIGFNWTWYYSNLIEFNIIHIEFELVITNSSKKSNQNLVQNSINFNIGTVIRYSSGPKPHQMGPLRSVNHLIGMVILDNMFYNMGWINDIYRYCWYYWHCVGECADIYRYCGYCGYDVGRHASMSICYGCGMWGKMCMCGTTTTASTYLLWADEMRLVSKMWGVNMVVKERGGRVWVCGWRWLRVVIVCVERSASLYVVW